MIFIKALLISSIITVALIIYIIVRLKISDRMMQDDYESYRRRQCKK